MVGETKMSRRFRLSIDLLALLTVVSLLLASYVFYSRIHESRVAQHNTVQAIRTVLCFAQQQVEEDPHVPVAQKKRAVSFYTHALERINALPCAPLTEGGTP